MQKEAKARIKINKLLEEAGWRLLDGGTGKANVMFEIGIKIRKQDLDGLGENFEKVKRGFVDFILLDDATHPIAVLEAKSEDKNPLDGKEQARKYAKSLNVRFVILSNGNLHYFWDIECGNPNVITKFPTSESLGHSMSFRPDPDAILKEEIKDDYIVLTQNSTYAMNPNYVDEKTRKNFIKENDLKFLRPYQLRAIEALRDSLKKGNNRFLFEMATGTGKTLLAAAIIKMFLRSGNAKRVLFLVDRLELEQQAWRRFDKWFKGDYITVIYKENRDDWKKADIVVSTIQSFNFDNKYRRIFAPNDFDFLISDEAHRSISGNSRAVFEYFTGYKLGLTATPKDYLKNIKDINIKDPREWERRQLLDTYETFGCKSGVPTFRYSLIDGVKDGYLVNPIVVDARTDISTQMLSDEGYAVIVETETGKEEKLFYHTDFEKKFFSDRTNRIFCETFMKNALRDPVSGEIGKSIIFCVSQNHASKITQMLNILADKMYPGKYKSDFAMQITSNIQDSQQFAVNFANNNLGGNTNFLEGYKSSRVRVCVTVGMMTTGYDCEDILNLCLMRPIFSPSDFVQIKGRGTRKYQFYYKNVDGEETRVEKKNYKLFDFFANYEYFEKKFNYDEVIKLPVEYKKTTKDDLKVEEEISFESFIIDPLKTYVEKPVGLEGMKVDRKLYEKFEEQVKIDEFIKENFEKGNLELVEDYIREKIFNKPEDYINLEKLRASLKLDRRIGILEIVAKIFGKITQFKTKDELLDEEVDKFIAIYKPDSKYVLPIKNFIKAYVTDNEIRDIVEKKEFSRFATNPKISMADFKSLNGWRDIIPDYIKDYVPINNFM
ncbi:MAG: DEAD/DEAH box helicase family protein [Candidatus Goldbacteria bacterium]|nr:DEAD/DEAH box helicase family protein [Candidatus Goldiibacteriota bacterium]